MIPPNLAAANYREYQAAVSESLATALGHAGVRHAVALSSIGAQLAEGAGPVSGLHHFEQRLRLVPGLNVLFLRPATFSKTCWHRSVCCGRSASLPAYSMVTCVWR